MLLEVTSESEMRIVAEIDGCLPYARESGRGTMAGTAYIYKKDHASPSGRSAVAVIKGANYYLLRLVGFVVEPPLC